MSDITTEPAVPLTVKPEPPTMGQATDSLIAQAMRHIPPAQRGAVSVSVTSEGATAVIAVRAARIHEATLDIAGYVEGTWRGQVRPEFGAVGKLTF